MILLSPLLQGLAYHNQRAEAANDQTPENGGLVARSPVDVLAGRGPEGDRGHCVRCVVGWVVLGARRRCGRGMAGGGGGVLGALMLACLVMRSLEADLLSRSVSPPPRSQWLGLAGRHATT